MLRIMGRKIFFEHIAGATSEYVVQLSRDGNNMLEVYLQTQSARGERKWDSLGSLMDWLTLGIVSGVWQGLVYRHEVMAAEPNLYNITNAITMGLLDNVKGSVVPEEPWSLEHWLDIVGVVLTIFAAYKTAKVVKKFLMGSADDAIHVPGTLGDYADDIAHSAELTQARICDIIDMLGGQRPDPKTYLSKEYIDNHLSMFKGGVTKFYATAPTGTIGPKSGTFVFSSPYADEIIKKTNGNVRLLEQLLGIPSGALGKAPVRVDIHYPTGLRIPSGNERGANDFWLPGGYTSGGLPEAVIDQVQPGSYSIYRIT